MEKIVKPLLWSVISLVFGLLQMWGVLIWCLIDKQKTFSVWNIIKDCGILFFCTSIMSAIALDFFIKEKKIKNISVIGAIYIIPTFLCLILSILIYGVCYFGDPDPKITPIFQFVILAFCIAYTTIVKYLEFNNVIK